MSEERSAKGGRRPSDHRARQLARRLALQALYQMEMNPRPWAEVREEFAKDPEAERVDFEYFEALMEAVAPNGAELDARLAQWSEIAPDALDPIERAVLRLGLYELEAQPEVPYRVALSEAVNLAKQFGATDGYKFVNAVLDRAAQALRPHEYGERGPSAGP